jgi:hypothetical protein
MSRALKFLIRVVGGFFAGLLLGVVQLGWSQPTQPIVLEYGLVVGSMAFLLTNYLEFRQRVLARVRSEREAPKSPPKKSAKPKRR